MTSGAEPIVLPRRPRGAGGAQSRRRRMAVPPASNVPFWSMMGFTFILFIAPQSFIPMLQPLHLALVTAVLAVMSLIYDRSSRGLPVVELRRETVIILMLLGWAVVTLPLSYWPGGSIEVLAGLYIKTVIVYWLLSHVVTTGPRLRRMAWGLTLMAIPIAFTALKHFVMGDFIKDVTPGSTRIEGYLAPLTGNPNDLALTLNLFLPLAVGLFLGSRSPMLRALLLGCICLDAIAVIATFSRAGFLTLCMIGAIYLWKLFKRGYRHLPLLALFVALAAVPLLPSGYVDRLSTITNIQADRTNSAQDRWNDSLAAMKYVIFHPVIGAGIGMDKLALNEVRGPTWTEVHDAYLEYAVDLGLPGLILFLLLVRNVLNTVGRAQGRLAREPEWAPTFYLTEGIRVSLIAFCLAALFHPIAYHFFFYFFAGLALAADALAANVGKAMSSPLPRRPFRLTPRRARPNYDCEGSHGRD